MSERPGIRLTFYKIHVRDMDAALAFWSEAFGFEVTMSFSEPAFLEHVIALPGQEGGPHLILVYYKDGREITVGRGHGPIGLGCDDIAAFHESALKAGAEELLGIFQTVGVQISMLKSPDGHEIELVQLPSH